MNTRRPPARTARSFATKILPAIQADFIDAGKARLIFREYPLDKVATSAFMLVRCLPEEKYFQMIGLLFETQPSWAKIRPRDGLLKIMAGAGMDEAVFDACLKRKDIFDGLYKTAMMAKTDFGVKGTPAIFVNGQAVAEHEEYAPLKAAIEAALGNQ